MPDFHLTENIGLLGAIFYGVLHGLTPHGHSWLVLLPFALGGAKARNMVRMAVIYSAGMLVTAAGVGALIGLLASFIPESWHNGLELGTGVILAAVGVIFMLKPLSAHHAIDHICSEGCQKGEEKALLRTGTIGALFTFGAMSMLIPCPTNFWIYSLPAVSGSPLTGAVLFTVYALFTGITVTVVALAMVRARKLVTALDQKGYRLIILRVSGLIILGVGLWLMWLGSHEHGHEHGHDDHALRNTRQVCCTI